MAQTPLSVPRAKCNVTVSFGSSRIGCPDGSTSGKAPMNSIQLLTFTISAPLLRNATVVSSWLTRTLVIWTVEAATWVAIGATIVPATCVWIAAAVGAT